MARQLLRDTCETARRIIDGELDDELDFIQQAASARLKNRFRKGMTVRLTGTKNPQLDGKTGTILKVNPKRISVGVGKLTIESEGTPFAYEAFSGGEYNVPPSMLELVP